MEQMVTPSAIRTTATRVKLLGVSLTPQQPNEARKNDTTIVSPAKGAISERGVIAKTMTSSPAAVTVKSMIPPQNQPFRYQGPPAMLFARLRHSIPSPDETVPSTIRTSPSAHKNEPGCTFLMLFSA